LHNLPQQAMAYLSCPAIAAGMGLAADPLEASEARSAAGAKT